MKCIFLASRSPCPDTWDKRSVNGQEYCFKSIGNKLGSAAQSECAAVGGSVPLPANAQEALDIRAYMTAKNINEAWVGVTDSAKEGEWRSFDGDLIGTGYSCCGDEKFLEWWTPVAGVYAPWHEAEPNVYYEPNDQGIAGEDYAVMFKHQTYWNDVSGTQSKPTLCWNKLDYTTVDSCNDANDVIEMKVTLRGREFTGERTYTVDDLQSSFSGNYLIMTKTLGGDGCVPITVDGVQVCSQVDETITLQCKYSLADQTVTDTFDVTGQDTTATAENTGTLKYNLSVEDNKAIGDEVTFTITPVNKGLVYATVKSCDVTNNAAGNTDQVTIIGHKADHCVNDLVGAKAITSLFTSNDVIQGSWEAFKWSTSKSDADAESQGLSCKIGLSENASTDPVNICNQPARN